MKTMYFAKYFANCYYTNQTNFMENLEFSNLQKAIQEIRKIAEARRPAGRWCGWFVRNEAGDRVAGGGMNCSGRRYRTV